MAQAAMIPLRLLHADKEDVDVGPIVHGTQVKDGDEAQFITQKTIDSFVKF